MNRKSNTNAESIISGRKFTGIDSFGGNTFSSGGTGRFVYNNAGKVYTDNDPKSESFGRAYRYGENSIEYLSGKANKTTQSANFISSGKGSFNTLRAPPIYGSAKGPDNPRIGLDIEGNPDIGIRSREITKSNLDSPSRATVSALQIQREENRRRYQENIINNGYEFDNGRTNRKTAFQNKNRANPVGPNQFDPFANNDPFNFNKGQRPQVQLGGNQAFDQSIAKFNQVNVQFAESIKSLGKLNGLTVKHEVTHTGNIEVTGLVSSAKAVSDVIMKDITELIRQNIEKTVHTEDGRHRIGG